MGFNLRFFQVTSEYRFKPNLEFWAHMHQIGAPFSEDYKHWETSGLTLTLMNPEDRSSLAIEHNRLMASIDIPTDPGILETRFTRAFKEYQKHVKISQDRKSTRLNSSHSQISY